MHRRIRSNPVNQNNKPMFNINAPFMNVFVAQLNHSMSIELQKFINSIEDVEDEIQSLQRALRDPVSNGAFVYREGPSFIVIRSFKGVVLVEMNMEMRNLLISFISEIDGGVDKLIWAFKLALENPGGRSKSQNVAYATKRQNGDKLHTEDTENDYSSEEENTGQDWDDGYEEQEED